MARGRGGGGSKGRSNFRSHTHSHSHSHSRGGGGGGGNTNAGAIFEASIDNMVNHPAPPTLVNGIYTFVGNEMSFRAQAEGGIGAALQPMQPMQQINLSQQDLLPGMMPPPNMMQDAFMGGMPMIPGGIPM